MICTEKSITFDIRGRDKDDRNACIARGALRLRQKKGCHSTTCLPAVLLEGSGNPVTLPFYYIKTKNCGMQIEQTQVTGYRFSPV